MSKAGLITNEVLDRIKHRAEERGLTERAVSMAAVGTGDVIRNWRRHADDGAPSSARADTLIAVADVLGMSLPELLGLAPIAAPDPATGFQESVAPYAGGTDDMRNLARALAPNACTIELFHAKSDFPAFAVLTGDILAVDLSRSPDNAEIAIIQVRDEETSSAHWVLARWAAPWIIPGAAGDRPVKLDPANARYAPYGVLVATLRSTDRQTREVTAA